MVKEVIEKVRIEGTLYFDGMKFDLIRATPQFPSIVRWSAHQDVFQFLAINPQGVQTTIYVHGSFLVDLSTAGEIRDGKLLIDDERSEETNRLQERINLLTNETERSINV